MRRTPTQSTDGRGGLVVLKADHTRESYDEAKVRRSLVRAIEASGEQASEYWAAVLSEAVTWGLKRAKDDGLVRSQEVAWIAETVLNETGFGAAAVALADLNRRRAQRRRELMVVADTQTGGNGRVALLRRPRRWDKSRLRRELQAYLRLSMADARSLSSSVEQELIRGSLTLVTMAYLCELGLCKRLQRVFN